MFDLACILLAAILALTATEKHKIACLVVAYEFILHAVAYDYILVSYRQESGWLIYLIYASIQLPTMLILFNLKSHFAIINLVFINLCYNLLTVLSFFHIELISIYYAYPGIVGIIMLLELAYLFRVNSYAARFNKLYRGRDSSNRFVVFHAGGRNSDRGVQ